MTLCVGFFANKKINMTLHQTTGRSLLGVSLALVTALFWGWLTILLKGLLANTDPYTITWYRFSVAGGLLALFVVWKYRLPSARKFQRSLLFWMIAIGGLASNYILYLLGLSYISPSTAQVVMQTAPMFMLIGSFVFFKERFVARQWLGYLVLVMGMLLFFNQRLIELFARMSLLANGVGLVAAGALSWAVYALAQKQLLKTFRPSTILMVLYLASSFLMLPLANPRHILHLNGSQLILLTVAGVSALISYVSFAEALKHIEASRASVVLALPPIITVVSTPVVASLWPNFIAHEQLSLLSIMGAILVVIGSMLVVILKTVQAPSSI